jgi:CRP-like cAMP-binding protein
MHRRTSRAWALIGLRWRLLCTGLVEPRFISMLAKMLRPRSIPANEMVIRKGDIGAEMFFVISGAAGIATHATGPNSLAAQL